MSRISCFAVIVAVLLVGWARPVSSREFLVGFWGVDSGDSLSKAHAAYAAGDFDTMVIEVKNALQSETADPLTKENVFALLNQAYKARGQRGLSVNWHMPEGITQVKVNVQLTQKEVPDYSIIIYGEVARVGLIKQMKLTRYPDQVFMNKQEGVGRWSEKPGQHGENPEFSFETEGSRQPIPGGLYLFTIELENGKNVDGWFPIGDDMNTATGLDLVVPEYGEVFQDGNPVFRWTDLRSAEFKSFETWSVWLCVSRSEPPLYEWSSLWEAFVVSPTKLDMRLGSSSENRWVSSLEDGRYMFTIVQTEGKRFGDIVLGRERLLMRPFVVRRKNGSTDGP